LFRRNQAKLTLPPLSSYIKKKGDDLISHPPFDVDMVIISLKINEFKFYLMVVRNGLFSIFVGLFLITGIIR
jgi:hypothetical protein